MVAYLEKSTGSAGFHPIIDFITRCHIHYALQGNLRVGVLEADLTKTKQTYSSAYTKLILRVKKLEAQIKVGKARRHSRFVLSDAEGVEDDSSKQGRKFSNEDQIPVCVPLVQDGDAADVDEHLYRSMIGSLMYLTSSRPDIMFVVCACARFQVSPKTSHLLVVKRIFRYLKGKPSLGLCYSKDSLLELVAYTDSDYAGATLDRKSTTGVATAITKAEYVAVASCYGQVLLEIVTDDDGSVKIHATIDGHSLSISEGSLRRHLKLDDQDGITSLPTTEIFAQLALMGYATNSDKLTFQKGAFSPQWRFLIHNILHCLSPKKTAWEQFSSNIAAAVICLATDRKFNFSRMIFDHMVSNISSPHKFLMYPRCLKMILQNRARMFSNEGFKDDEGVHEIKASMKLNFSYKNTAEEHTLVLLAKTATYSKKKLQRKEKMSKMHEDQRAQKLLEMQRLARLWEERKENSMDEAESTKKLTGRYFSPLDIILQNE
ncbi:hypothetical protein Tco_0491025 [Tanacetum coccineum]